MITVTNVVCNFANEQPEYPSSLNGQTFSIGNGFEFTISITVSGLAEGETVTFGLIQCITASVRKIGNAGGGDRITFPGFPQLDGDPSNFLWYTPLTAETGVGNGDYVITLNDNPQTNCSTCIGAPTCVNVYEDFKIILASLAGGAYTTMTQWGWGYNCNARKQGQPATWVNQADPVLYFNQDAAVTVNLTQLNPQVRANTSYVTTPNTDCA